MCLPSLGRLQKSGIVFSYTAFFLKNTNRLDLFLKVVDVKNIKKLLGLLLLLPVVLLVAMFIIDNQGTASVELPGLSVAELSIGTWMVLSFALGGIGGVLFSSSIILRLRARLARLERVSSK